jgi:hypothetical protein
MTTRGEGGLGLNSEVDVVTAGDVRGISLGGM